MFALVLAATIATFGSGEVPPPSLAGLVRPGDRVRLDLTPGLLLSQPSDVGERTGKVLNVDDRSLTVALDRRAKPEKLDVRWIRRIDVSLGPKSRGGSALRAGGYATAAGFLLGILLAQSQDEQAFLVIPPVVLGTVIGVPFGVVGFVLGALLPGEHWERVLPAAPRSVPTASPWRSGSGRAALRLSIRF